MTGPDAPVEDEDDDEQPADADTQAVIDGDLSALTADEVRRRTEAPLPRSLLDFLR
jgi:hypothetical protein